MSCDSSEYAGHPAVLQEEPSDMRFKPWIKTHIDPILYVRGTTTSELTGWRGFIAPIRVE